MEGDLVLVNGRIHCPGKGDPWYPAAAVRSGRIVCLGSETQARAGSPGEVLDLGGACVLPGLVDAHLHFEELALGLHRINLDTPSLEEALARVAARASSAAPGSWILGQGWNANAWGQSPTAAMLDAVAPANPVCLQDKSCHAVWVNSSALAAAGIVALTPEPPDGKLVRDGAGRPTGLLLEGAVRLVVDRVPVPTGAELEAAFLEAAREAHRLGLTGVHDFDGSRALSAHAALHARGELSLRVLKSLPFELLGQALALGLRSGIGDDMFGIGHVKLFADGAMGPQTAWLLADYEGRQGYRGMGLTAVGELRGAILRANSAGLACAVHAIGDRANREVLDVFESVRGELGGAAMAALAMPNRIEHVQLLDPADRGRLASLGIVASMQPIHATSEIELTEKHWGARAEGAYGFKTQLRAGAVLAFGSDCPVETLDPIAGIHAAVTRRKASGEPGSEGWFPAERLSVAEAVEAYSLGPARAAGRAARTGSIELGKLADFTVLDRDIFGIPTQEIASARVLATIVGGRLVWRRD